MNVNIKTFPNGKVILGDVFDVKLGHFPLIIADPPYGNIVDEEWDNKWTYDDYLLLAFKIESLLEEGGSAFVWGGIGKQGNRQFFKFLASVEEETGLKIQNMITWSKKRAYGKKNDYLFTREEVVWLVKGDKPKTFNIPLLDIKRGYAGYSEKYPAKSEFKRRTNVWTDITEVLRGKKHICEKPERLAEVIIETHSNPGEEVLDLFSGSGNVSLVAERIGRRFVAVEGHKQTFNDIVQRLAA